MTQDEETPEEVPTKGTVKVEFAMEEAKAENTYNTVEAETTGFSFYTVEFTYNGLQLLQ